MLKKVKWLEARIINELQNRLMNTYITFRDIEDINKYKKIGWILYDNFSSRFKKLSNYIKFSMLK